MKTNHLLVIRFFILLLFLVSFSVNYSQQQNLDKGMFVRVFSNEGKKIAKGHIVFVRDSILGLKSGTSPIELKVRDIGAIKTKRSTGHNVFVSSIVGAGLCSLIGAATSKEETKTRNVPIIGEYQYTTGVSSGTGAIIGAGVGATGGAVAGLGISLFKKSRTISVNGDLEKWKAFKSAYENQN